MILDQLIQAVVTVVGLTMSFAYYPQAWKILRTRSADDISLTSYIILCIGTTTWTLFGFYRHDNVIIASFIFGSIGSILVLLLALYFRKKNVKFETTER